MVEKTYHLSKSYVLFLTILACWLFGYVVFWLILPSNLQALTYLFLAGAIVISPLAFLFNTQEIVFDEKGVTFRRRIRTTTFRKITDLDVRMSRGNEVGLKITGVDTDGETVRTIRFARQGEVHRRWDEFKKDLQKIKSN